MKQECFTGAPSNACQRQLLSVFLWHGGFFLRLPEEYTKSSLTSRPKDIIYIE